MANMPKPRAPIGKEAKLKFGGKPRMKKARGAGKKGAGANPFAAKKGLAGGKIGAKKLFGGGAKRMGGGGVKKPRKKKNL